MLAISRHPFEPDNGHELDGCSHSQGSDFSGSESGSEGGSTVGSTGANSNSMIKLSCASQAQGAKFSNKLRRETQKGSRVVANRRSAQRSRIRKLQHISELEKSVDDLSREVQEMLPQLQELEIQHQNTVMRNKHLKQCVAVLNQQQAACAAGADAAAIGQGSQSRPEAFPTMESQPSEPLTEAQITAALQAAVSGMHRSFSTDLLATMHSAFYGKPHADAEATPSGAPAMPKPAEQPRSSGNMPASQHDLPASYAGIQPGELPNGWMGSSCNSSIATANNMGSGSSGTKWQKLDAKRTSDSAAVCQGTGNFRLYRSSSTPIEGSVTMPFSPAPSEGDGQGVEWRLRSMGSMTAQQGTFPGQDGYVGDGEDDESMKPEALNEVDAMVAVAKELDEVNAAFFGDGFVPGNAPGDDGTNLDGVVRHSSGGIRHGLGRSESGRGQQLQHIKEEIMDPDDDVGTHNNNSVTARRSNSGNVSTGQVHTPATAGPLLGAVHPMNAHSAHFAGPGADALPAAVQPPVSQPWYMHDGDQAGFPVVGTECMPSGDMSSGPLMYGADVWRKDGAEQDNGLVMHPMQQMQEMSLDFLLF